MKSTMKALLAGALILLAAEAQAQAWPTKPIKLVAPYPPGGQTDVVARYFAEKLTGVLGQQVIVENKAGAQGMVGAEIVKNAAPDGYTFVYVNSSMMCINPYVYKKMPYDGFKDFVPVTQHGLAPLAMVVLPTLGPKSVKEFVAWAKERKGKVNYASFGLGSSSHIWGEMLNQAEKLDMTHVPYKGAGPAIQDTLAGHIPVTIQDLASSGPAISGGKLLPLAVTSAVRWPRLPNVPTFNEVGYKIDLVGWNGIMAPAGTPKEIVERLSAEIRKVVQAPEGKEKLLDMGLFATGTTPAEMTEIMKTGCAAWGDAVKRAGVEPE
ncbi:MAG: tripartite tricarboxylate transporter substrate binding protein [Reyranella sp.]|uniref:Bug family tripartite tricarboxylate transporter substrate binding protein n=1 Tax=Reyranella sp. TaxID=1929291 RepID=UPI00272F7A1F|nr:tripartite tricarboxylate transporter substrate binding protein [Reyranella sp.]MDP1966735.1 tripartite tricarboxylate transporter substrate binding protein [Reyranella sp.]MDP2374755.1 tripartite tricarboxylate transporter substrate binding protein [Reyranella sp.]